MSATTNNIEAAALEARKKKPGPMDYLFKTVNIIVPKVGDLLEGKMLGKRGRSVFVDLGVFGTGIIFGKEFINARDLIKKLGIGDPLTVKVIELEGENGYVELSLSGAKHEAVWTEAQSLLEKHTPIPLTVLSANKGGLVLEWRGVQGFLPTSQLKAAHYPRVDGGDKEKIANELRKLVGEKLSVVVITANQKEGKLIFSEKHSDSEETKGLVSKYKVGDAIIGTVTGVVEFGIFIKLEEGLEGLAHISELDWSLVEDPSKLFKVGDEVKAKVIGIESGKVSLSVKALTPDPWTDIKDKHKKGDIVEGEVVRFNQYGSLVCLTKGVCGLVHISEFKSEHEMKEKLEVGKKYPFQISLFEPDNHRMIFSFLKEGEKKG
ncbi:MAG: S1 RNA-binding domain-containing protein [Candidatus Niyogibacteria bacterium]|nr:S1 RNA-binding domain-containing protein [Candidatus Niyogibacteria bacterium]